MNKDIKVMALVERSNEVCAYSERLTVIGKKIELGEMAPDFSLDYLDLIDMKVHRTRLADSAGMVRLLSVVNSLDMQICHRSTMRWEQRCASMPSDACIYTVSMDLPFAQALWQTSNGIIHQALSAWRSERFGCDYGILLKEWQLLQRSVFVIDRDDRLIYAEYIADQTCEPDYTAALKAVCSTIPCNDHSIR
jgi:thioredoxin-dependent peroxiredoxin